MVLCNECGSPVPRRDRACPECGAPAAVFEDKPCSVCGGRRRRGSLYSESELTIIFEDDDEERFIQTLVCRSCGVVTLDADYETDVED